MPSRWSQVIRSRAQPYAGIRTRATGQTGRFADSPWWRIVRGVGVAGWNNASAWHGYASILEPVVTFKREIRLRHETGVTQRALMIRDDADTCWLASQMEHGRITDPDPALRSDTRSSLIQRRIDVDLFVVSLHRLHTVAELAAEVADPRSVLSGALDRFSSLTAGLPLSERKPDQPTTITSVRNVFEHWQNLAIRGGLGLASSPDGWWVSYRDRMFETKDLLAAAEDLHRAIRAAVDPEAFSDFRGDRPLIELRDPKEIVRPWRPGSEIIDRQTATMAKMHAELHDRARSASAETEP